MRRRIISILLVLCMLINLLPMQVIAEGGDSVVPPSNGDVYEISTAEQLNWFSGLVNGTLTDGTAQNKAAKGKLMNDITATNDFVPIGGYGSTTTKDTKNLYTGEFDGGMHTVTLNINQADKIGQGLFGIVGAGTVIQNLGVAGTVSGASYVAGIIGASNSTGTLTISNCWNEASIEVKSNRDNGAGIFGRSFTGEDTITISNCYNTGIIKGRSYDSYGVYLTGIAAWMGKNGTIINSYNVGKVGQGAWNKTFADGNNLILTNCYELKAVGGEGASIKKTEVDFKSGQVAYLLNGSTVETPLTWGQTLGTDDYPKFNKLDNTVYPDDTGGYVNIKKDEISAQISKINLNGAEIKITATAGSEIYYVVSDTPLTIGAEILAKENKETYNIPLNSKNGVINLTGLTANADYTYYLVKKISEEEYSNVVALSFSTIALSLNQNSFTIEKGHTETLVATVEPNELNTGLIWSSSDEKIATVADGLVTAVGKGTATIKVTIEGRDVEASCQVTVKQIYDYTTLSGNKAKITGYNGDSKEILIPTTIDGLKVTSIGEDAFREKGLTKVTLPEGLTEIGSSAFYKNKLTSIIIPESVTFIPWNNAFVGNADPFTVYGKPGSAAETMANVKRHIFKQIFKLNKSRVYMEVSEEESLQATILEEPTSENLTWSSTDPNVVSVDSGGKVTALANGKTQIKAKTNDNKYEYIAEITVVEKPLLNSKDVYEIGMPEDLNWFSYIVNTSIANAKGKLMADIIATDDFVAIGPGTPQEKTEEGYTGEFDGNGKKVKLNINKPNKMGQGLFGILGGGAIIKNVAVEGTILAGHYTAGIAGMTKTAGTVTISNCWNEATVTTDASSGYNAAGILGVNAYFDAEVTIANCYNIGNIKGSSESAAMTGWLGKNGRIINSYNMGSVSGNSNFRTFARFDDGNLQPFTNSYQLDTVGSQSNKAGFQQKSLEEFASGAVGYLLNSSSSIEPLSWGQKLGEGGDNYPIFHNGNNTIYKATDTEEYYNRNDKYISAELIERTINSAKINVNGDPGSEILYLASETQLTKGSEIENAANKKTYNIPLNSPNGQIILTGLEEGKDYAYYLVKKTGEVYSNVVEIKFSTTIVTLDKESLAIKTGKADSLTATVNPSSIILTWSSGDENIASVEKYENGAITIKSKSVGKTLIEGRSLGGNIVSSFQVEVGDVIMDHTGFYEIESPADLDWFAGLVNGSLEGIERNRAAKGKLMVDITATDNFTPIAKEFANPYMGTFDGNGKTVTLNINKPDNSDGQGLFGNVTGGTNIKNVAIDGTIIGRLFVGGLIGRSQSRSNGNSGEIKISNCWNKATVTATSQYAGGILAYNYDANSVIIESCHNSGAISGGSQKRAGAITTYLGDNGKIINSSNSGSVTEYQDGKIFADFDSTNTNPFTNCYQLDKVGTQVGVISKTLEEFKSGEIAYMLNNSTSEGSLAWGQAIGIDDGPIFKTVNNTVFKSAENIYYNKMGDKITAESIEVTLTSAKINVKGDLGSKIHYVVSEIPLTSGAEIVGKNGSQEINLTTVMEGLELTGLTEDKEYAYYFVKEISTGVYSDLVSVKFTTILVTLKETSMDLLPEQIKSLEPTIQPSGTKNIIWSSSNPDIVSVDSNGIVTAIKNGRSIIKATAKGGNFLASCEIKVEQIFEYGILKEGGINKGIDIKAYTGKSKIVEIPQTFEGLPVTQISFKGSSTESAFYNKGLTKVTIPDTVTILHGNAFAGNSLESIVLPEGITFIQTWVFDDNKVPFTIYGKPGTPPESYALYKGYIFKPVFDLNKTKLYISEEKEESLTVKLAGELANENVTWSIIDNSVATVDQNGLVKALKEGKTDINVKTKDGKYESLCQVTVISKVTAEELDEEGYFKIGTPEELNRFSAIVNSGKTDFKGKLMADIVATDDFIPIGFGHRYDLSVEGYTGEFDGNGKTVTLNIDTIDKAGQGLFRIISDGASIKNLGVKGKVSGGSFIAGIAGVCNASDDSTITISNCSNSAEVITKSSKTVANYANDLSNGEKAAGILGGVLNNPNILIENCYNTGKISGKKESAAIAGWLGTNGKIKNSYNIGSVSGNEAGKTFARFSQENTNPITNSYQLNTVSVQTGVTQKTTAQFKSGELVILLNDPQSQIPIWAQIIGINDYPVFYDGSNKTDVSGELLQATTSTAKIKVQGNPNTTVYYIVKEGSLTSAEIETPTIDESEKIALDSLGNGEIILTGLTSDREHSYYLLEKIGEKSVVSFSGKFLPRTISTEASEMTINSGKIKVKGGMNSTIYYLVKDQPLTGEDIQSQVIGSDQILTLDSSGNGEINLSNLTPGHEYTYYLVEKISENKYLSISPKNLVATTMTVDKTKITLRPGKIETLQLIATVLPGNGANTTVTWTSSDVTVVTVDENGLLTLVAALDKDGIETGVAKRTATITVSTKWGSNVEKIDVEVLSDFRYVVSDQNTITITSKVGSNYDIEIPYKILGRVVTSIGNNAFRYYSLKSLIIPEGVTHIGNEAFRSNFISNLIIPKGVTSIGDMAFYQSNNLTNVTIPKGVTFIGAGAFKMPDTSTKKLTIYGQSGSLAQDYAGNNSHEFIEKVSLNKTQVDIIKRKTERLIATVLPESAVNKKVIWSSSNPEIASVDESGLITGVAKGQATITVTTEDGGCTATSIVDVKESVDVSVSGVTVKDRPATVDITDPTIYNIELSKEIKISELTSEDIIVTATDLGASVGVASKFDNGIKWTVVVISEDKSTSETYTINITGGKNDYQLPPTELAGVAPASIANNDGRITGTTTEMEYKLSSANEWKSATDIEITGLVPGTYELRYAAKVGYLASLIVRVEVKAYAKSSDASLSNLTVDGVAVEGFATNIHEYNIELSPGTKDVPEVVATLTDGKANAVVTPAPSLPGTTKVVVTSEDGATVKTYTINFTVESNKDQNMPIGLIGIAPTSSVNDDGKITGTTTDMEYKLSSAVEWTKVTGTEITGLRPQTYQVRVAARKGYNASPAVAVEVKAYVLPVTLSSIEIKTPADKLIYKVGETLDITGLVIEGTYSDDSKNVETITVDNITGFNSIQVVASQTLTVTVDERTTTYTIEIKALDLEPVDPDPVNKTVLIEAISSVKYVSVSEDGLDIEPSDQWTTAEIKATLEEVVIAAQEIADKEDASQEEVNQAVTTLASAVTVYNSAKAFGTKEKPVDPDPVNKTVLIEAISSVKYVSVSEDGLDIDFIEKWTTEEAKTKLEEAVAIAQEVVDKEDVTQEEIDEAVTILLEARSAYEAAQLYGLNEEMIDECFIATASYGSKFTPSVVLLRHFRDDYLLTNKIGANFVKFYYKNSPKIAEFIRDSEMLKALTRLILTPFVVVVWMLYNPIMIFILLAFALLYFKRKRLKINN